MTSDQKGQSGSSDLKRIVFVSFALLLCNRTDDPVWCRGGKICPGLLIWNLTRLGVAKLM